MKISKYVIESRRDGDVALFDSRTGTALFTSDEEYQAILDAMAGKSVSNGFQLLEALKQNGFLVDESADEVADQKALFQKTQQDCSTVRLCLAPTYACNLDCHYCYEKGVKEQSQKMAMSVVDAVIRFVEQLYDLYHFQTLEVEWYGGDPSLALDRVESLSKGMIDFCAKHNVQYSAFMLSNCTCIDADAAKLLKDVHVDNVLITLDGPHDQHNNRRPRIDGKDSYESTMQAIAYMLDAGIKVDIQSNIDKVGASWFSDLSNEMQDRFGITPRTAKLNDYYGSFGCGKFCSPGFDLFDHEEFAHYDFEVLKASHPSAEQVQARLMPAPLFCSGQMESSFVIDAKGDVFKCDGRIGDAEYKICNVQDENLEPAIRNFDTALIYPFDDKGCIDCNLLPLCLGTCKWERECCGYPCHPLRYMLDDYLWLLRDCQLAEG